MSVNHDEHGLAVTEIERGLNKIRQSEQAVELVTRARWRELGDLCQKELAAWWEQVKWAADEMMPDAQGQSRLGFGGRLVLENLPYLAVAWRITGEQRYLEATLGAMREAVAKSKWTNTPLAFDLASAGYVATLAVTLNMLGDAVERSLREQVWQAMAERGLHQAAKMYRSEVADVRWVKRHDNWNTVCNAAVMLGAIELIGDARVPGSELAWLLDQAICSIRLSLAEYAPDGGGMEGPSYWRYATNYLALGIEMLERSLGSSYGLMELPGVSKLAWFWIHASGPSGQTFNFSDGSPAQYTTPALTWLARRNADANAWWHRQHAVDTWNRAAQAQPPIQPSQPRRFGAHAVHWMDLIWADAGALQETSTQTCSTACAAYFRHIEMVSLRSSWHDAEAIWLACKGGSSARPHAHMDLGTLVLEMLGQRWAIDLGHEDYAVEGLWETWAGSSLRHFMYYRNRAEGHNTLVLNPHLSPQQDLQVLCRFERMQLEVDEPWAILDLSPAYHRQASSVKRGIRLLAQQQAVLIRDEVRAAQAVDWWWMMHTCAQVQTQPTGDEVVLQQGGQAIQMRYRGNHKLQWEVMPAEPLMHSPRPAQGDRNQGVQRLTLHQACAAEPWSEVMITKVGEWPRWKELQLDEW